jgi:hypothetical protein
MIGFSVGQRVRHSGIVIQRKRDYWNSCGREPMKSGARKALDAAIAERGTVTAILAGDSERGVSPGLEVTWDSGSVSRCLSYVVTPE